ncbi:hypothetical protein [Myxococcus landrumensis]|uniref:Lipoprotein n=1 Tax=Myxococcus landrumensis TaxID=2813577 RepID=A0ABX7N145_9BACT|nr:hypothetical protein [Myxococcus landrumus]QSQ12434.1 hypothetical protein JY572_29305 [Myxococcus landrumus]
MRLGGALLACWLAAWTAGCGHAEPSTRPAPEAGMDDDASRVKGNSVHARILALIARGEFTQAQALIAEGTAAGLLSREVATRLTERIAALNTRLGDIPASLTRVHNFPSQLKDTTLFEIRRMLQTRDFSVATQSQLNLAKKLIQEQKRLLED